VLEDAVVSADSQKLIEADILDSAFIAKLEELEAGPFADSVDLEILRRDFDSYYASSRTVAASLARHRAKTDTHDLIPMREREAALVVHVNAMRDKTIAGMNKAFGSAGFVQDADWVIGLLIAIGAIILLRESSQSMSRSLTASVVTALDGAEREIKARTADAHTARERAEVANRTKSESRDGHDRRRPARAHQTRARPDFRATNSPRTFACPTRRSLPEQAQHGTRARILHGGRGDRIPHEPRGISCGPAKSDQSTRRRVRERVRRCAVLPHARRHVSDQYRRQVLIAIRERSASC
jgi:hypothetical protein